MDRFKLDGKRVIWTGHGEVVWVEPYGANIIRVRASKALKIDLNDWTLLPAEVDNAQVEINNEKAVISNGKLSATITDKGVIHFTNLKGEVLLGESWGTERFFQGREYKSVTSDVFRIEQYFMPDKNEHFFGLGQESHDLFDLKGSVIDLCQQNTKCTIPFLISTKKYGFLWNNPAIGRVELANNRTKWSVMASKQIDYLVIAGDDMAEIVRRYSDISGKTPMLPEWAAGLWQSKLRYETQVELLQVAREYKRRGLPLSVIIIDYFHWPQQGEWKFDKRYWPDPQAMVEELNQMGIRTMVSVWPTVDVRSENYVEMLEKNYFIRGERGTDVIQMCRGAETYYDTTHPEAGAFVFSKIKQNYYAYGIKNFWLDEAEPEFEPYDYDNLRLYAGNGLEVSSIYPFYYAKNFYDGLTGLGEREIVNLIRCAWVGSQRFGIVLWSGDIESTFESLRKQIKAGLHVSLCGIPWWTTDIGGFKLSGSRYGGDPADPDFRELMVRWFQFGAFCPIFRMHGLRYLEGRPVVPIYDVNAYAYSGGPNEVWSYGEQAYEIMTRYLFIREQIKPYLLEQMKKASSDGTPVMRPLFYDFDEELLVTIDDEYMFGPDLLVAPVTELHATSRKVYLPKGVNWKDVNTGQVYEGGKTIQVETPLETMPLFTRDGSLLRIG